MKRPCKIFGLLLGACAAMLLPSCMKDDDEETDYEWKEANEAFFAEKEAETDKDGNKVYESVTPSFAADVNILMKWHNDRALTQMNISPMDNSTCDFKYSLELMDGEEVQNSYEMTTYGDSIYRAKPLGMIVGVHAALTQMHAGDSVTVVIPYRAGYGQYSSGDVPAFSTLIYHLKLVGVPAYEIPTPVN